MERKEFDWTHINTPIVETFMEKNLSDLQKPIGAGYLHRLPK